MVRALAALLALAGSAAPAAAFVPEFRLLVLPDGTRIEHALVLPEGWQPGRAYPVLLALPPGAQDRAMVEAGLQRYWGEHAAGRGWIVISPAAPRGVLFHEGSERHVQAIVHAVLAAHPAEGGRVHLAGASSGGLSAFRAARLSPELFHSLTVLPGFAPAAEDLHDLDALRDLPVRMHVGGADTAWLVESRRTEQRLRAAGARVSLEVHRGEGHAPAALEGGRVMDELERVRRELGLAGAPAAGAEAEDVAGTFEMLDEDAVADLLDAFHAAASRADEEGYFGLFAPEAVFLGTDPAERWTLEQFRAYAAPHFRKGRGWTYVPQERHVVVSSGGGTAWFDEVLENEKYGTCRGTGVALRTAEGWRVAHYSLTFLIPNEAAEAALEAARDALR
jgi:dienelactone hydrolase